MKVKDFLIKSGVYPNIQGFKYLVDAVEICKELEEKEKGEKRIITTKIYPMVALKHETTPSKVERAIRHALTKIKTTDFKEIGLKPAPTNGEFIYYFAYLGE